MAPMNAPATAADTLARDVTKPVARPERPYFSSGPCAKRPGWDASHLATASLGRSHRSSLGKARLQRVIELTRSLLRVPDDYRIGIVPASDTGAVEMAMWSMLGARPVTMLGWESFGRDWITDVTKQLELDDCEVVTAPYGDLPDLHAIDTRTHDVVFTANGTTSGVRVPNYDWIAADREGLTIVDATSAAFAQAIDWPKCDVLTFSWQKALGGEGAHGMLILGPRAVERLEGFDSGRPLPKIFRLTKRGADGGGELIKGIFEGATINTPSMLAVEDAIDALEWVERIGGLGETMRRSDESLSHIEAFVTENEWLDFLPRDPKTRSNTSVCLRFTDPKVTALDADGQAAFAKRIVKRLEAEDVALDIGAYRDAPPGLRIWCGATVEPSDVAALMPWIAYAHAQELTAL